MRLEDVRPARSPLDVLRDARGRVLVVYHGTAALFDQLRPSTDGAYGPGIYFTTSKRAAWFFARNGGVAMSHGLLSAPRVIAAALTMQRPFRDGIDSVPNDPSFFDSVARHGFDGIIAEADTLDRYGSGELMLIVPDARQVRTLR